MGWVENNTNKDPMAKVGMRVRMLSMDDELPVDGGMEGTIHNIDDLGTLHVKWDDGRSLGVIPGIDNYQLLPSEEEQISPDEFESMFEASDPKPFLKGSKSTSQGKKVTKNWKSALSKSRPNPRIKIESEEVLGGKAEGMTTKDLAKKHDVSVEDIEKEIKVGTEIEMEHTDSKKMAKEIAMDHIAEFPDYYTNKKHGVKASEKGLEKDLEETTTAGAAGAYNAPLFGKETTIRKPKAKKLASNIITKGDLKNPLGKIYSFKPKTESKVIKFKDLVNEVASTHASKLRAAEGTFDGDPWVGKKGWMRKDELAWEGGEIADILAKMDINWNDSDLTLTDKQTDKINEGWLFKSKEDKLTLNILKRVKERWPSDAQIMNYRSYRDRNKEVTELPEWGKSIWFTLPGIEREAKIDVACFNYRYGGGTGCSLRVNDRDLEASKWAIKKLYNYMFEKIYDEAKVQYDRAIQSDLTDPSYAEDVFDMLDDEDTVNEGKKKKYNIQESMNLLHGGAYINIDDDEKEFVEQYLEPGKLELHGHELHYDEEDEDVMTIMKDLFPDISYGYDEEDDDDWYYTVNEGKESFRNKIDDARKMLEAGFSNKDVEKIYGVEAVNQANFEMEDPYHDPNPLVNEGKKKKEKESPIHKKKWERCVKDVKKKNKENKTDYNPYAVCTASIGYEGSIKKPHRRKEKEEIEETTTFSSVFGSGYPVTPFMFAKKGKHIPSKKPIWKGGKIVQKTNKADLLGESLLDEINKVKWVKGGKFIKFKDRCVKYNNQPHCSQGAIDNPIELSDTAFENVKKVAKKMNISEGDVLNKIKAKLRGVSKEQMEYNKEHGLPIWWQGSKEGFYEYMEPRKNNTGSN